MMLDDGETRTLSRARRRHRAPPPPGQPVRRIPRPVWTWVGAPSTGGGSGSKSRRGRWRRPSARAPRTQEPRQPGTTARKRSPGVPGDTHGGKHRLRRREPPEPTGQWTPCRHAAGPDPRRRAELDSLHRAAELKTRTPASRDMLKTRRWPTGEAPPPRPCTSPAGRSRPVSCESRHRSRARRGSRGHRRGRPSSSCRFSQAGPGGIRPSCGGE